MNRTVVPAGSIGTLGDAWRACVGTGRFNLALRQDYQDSLALVQREIGFRYIRGHGLLSDDAGVHRPFDVAGHRGTRYAFTYVDQVVDAYLSLGIKPFLELGFMPEALASGPDTVFWWRGNITPPRDHAEWARLVRAVLRHLVDRYGLDEVRTWPIEVWNEPNLDVFWKDADQDAYFRLYEVTARAIKDVDASLPVGGPVLSPGADDWWEPFAEFVTSRDVPIDFTSFHAYTTGPAEHVPFGVYQTLKPPRNLLDQFARPKELLAGTPLADLPAHVSEFNSSYRPDNPVHDTAYNAAYLAPVLAGGGDLVDSFAYWTFSDVFEEVGIPTSILHGGFGMLTHRQLKKPTYHLYAFMARMGGEVLARGADHLVTRDPASGRVTVLAWQPVGGSDAPDEPDRHEVRLSVPVLSVSSPTTTTGADSGPTAGSGSATSDVPSGSAAGSAAGLATTPARAFLLRHDVDVEHGNVWHAWGEMGRPASPSSRQLDLLRETAEPRRTAASAPIVSGHDGAGRVDLDLTLGRHGVTLVEIDVVRDETPSWLDDARILGRTPA
ncbi:GH39 family glycosyl hydrolase [Myceligenerans pegani]|uniref:Xylan 1,4-beta-xylosidase n=1 Tax=Myceligenerans pegani TaxID=2776917 RepID=A0ABR9N671_9MICO|nr:xylan 1,4-beta-xylosidase [Myceligenerans sp. TRM 65318]MBE1878771.1 xylan 1,4-beta-xylosidase [Myceligenerans sp. TRM 65318]MBE3021042.1 xylan 1,4-beta-xylosidase [Myceligenerans sp. TRM 65318]